MTKQRNLKAKIRARMEKTGERYTAARAHVLAAGRSGSQGDASPHFAGVLHGYDRFGGVQEDTAPLAHMLHHAGVRFPGTGEPYTEIQLHGLSGGPGFLYAVFEYQGHAPMLTIVPRSRSMPQTYLEPVFERMGVEKVWATSSTEKAGARKLQKALDDGQPALCLVDRAYLPQSATPLEMAGMGPTFVAVIGSDPGSGDLWIDDRACTPLPLDRATFTAAHGRYRQGKRAMITLGEIDSDLDWQAQWRAALADTVRTLRDGDPTVPKSFRSNCGLAGMEKWRGLLTNAKNKKGWPRVFESGPEALAGLSRAYVGIGHEYTPPAAGRPLYALFLRQAAELLELSESQRAELGTAAEAFDRAGKGWTALADTIRATPDPAVRRACELADERALALDDRTLDDRAAERMGALVEERRGLAAECRLSADDARAVYAAMADHLGPILDAEGAAVEALARAQEGEP